MTDLSREAKALVEAGRDGWRPSAADRARILGKLTAGSVAVVTNDAAAAPGAPEALGNQASLLGRTFSPWGWVGLPIVASAVALLGVELASDGAAPAPGGRIQAPAPVASVESAPAAPSASPPVARAVPVVAAVAPARAPSAPVTTRKRETTAEDAARDRLREEVALLSKAQTELYGGQARQALATLDEHERRFRNGALAEERLAARIRALCALGRNAEAEAKLEALARRSPTSPYLEGARQACGRGRR